VACGRGSRHVGRVSKGWSFDSLRSLRIFDLTWPAMREPAAGEGGTKAGRMVSLNFTSWNQMTEWLTRIEALRRVA
jgi:hypothetical protein